MDYLLTSKYQHAKRLKNKTIRSLMLYFLNDILIFTQKVPFDEKSDHGYNKWHYNNQYLYNGYLYQTRFKDIWDNINKTYKRETRNVKYPISKEVLNKIGVPINLKIELSQLK